MTLYKHVFKIPLIVLAASFLAASALYSARVNVVVAAPLPERVVRLFYYQGGKLARKSFFAHPSSVDIFAPQVYSFDDNGKLGGKLDPELLAFARAHEIKVMPLVTNRRFSQKAYEMILNDAGRQSVAIDALVTEAKKNSYSGWQIDFEQMDVSVRDAFSTFVQNTATAMKQNGLAVSVAVMAHVSENPEEYPKDLWQKIVGVYDYSALAASADFVSVMTYDDPSSKGPVAGYLWYKRVLKYALAHIPKEKLSMGIPLYYWQWSDASGKLVGIGGNEGIDKVFKKHKVSVHYSAAEESPYLHYWSKGKGYTIWYENARSVAKKISLITENDLRGMSFWALGLELPSVHSVVKK